MYIIIGIIISITILIVTFLGIRFYYIKKKRINEKSKEADEKLKRIDFNRHKDYFK